MPSKTSVDRSPAERRDTRRAERYAAQRVVWKITDRERQAYCGRFLNGLAEGVAVKVTAPGTEQARAGFSGLQTCGSVWACPVCSEKINAERQAEIEAGIRAWLEAGNSILFGTFTLSHGLEDGLEDLWNAISPAWAKVVGGTSWHGGKKALGDKARFGVAGWLRVVEVKDGANGWHPHIHALFFVKGRTMTGQQLEDFKGRMFGRWNKHLGERGFHALEGIGVDLRRVGDAEALGHYFAKNTYGSTDPGGAAYEVTGSQSKRQGKGGVTPFQLLERIVSTDADLEQLEDGSYVSKTTGELLGSVDRKAHARDLARWAEWERVSAGRRQLTWSKGLRDLLELDAERTDEEVAEDDSAAGEVVAVLSRDEWKAGAWAYKRARLLEWAERGELLERLASWRLEWTEAGALAGQAPARAVEASSGWVVPTG